MVRPVVASDAPPSWHRPRNRPRHGPCTQFHHIGDATHGDVRHSTADRAGVEGEGADIVILVAGQDDTALPTTLARTGRGFSSRSPDTCGACGARSPEGQVRWVSRTFWSRTARDNEWWNAFLPTERSRSTGGASPTPAPAPAATTPPPPGEPDPLPAPARTGTGTDAGPAPRPRARVRPRTHPRPRASSTPSPPGSPVSSIRPSAPSAALRTRSRPTSPRSAPRNPRRPALRPRASWSNAPGAAPQAGPKRFPTASAPLPFRRRGSRGAHPGRQDSRTARYRRPRQRDPRPPPGALSSTCRPGHQGVGRRPARKTARGRREGRQAHRPTAPIP